MDSIELLSDLVANQYGAHPVQLEPLHRFASAERGIFRVERAAQPPWLLRAYRQEPGEDRWLVQRAATLLYLEQRGYPAPRLVHTRQGEMVGRQHGWATLMLTFVKGTVDEQTGAFDAIGAALARLHTVDVRTATSTTPPVPFARWQPQQQIFDWIAALHALAGQIPAELDGVYRFTLESLQRVVQWPPLPAAILHTDCWVQNAVQTIEGEIVLIDWDGAGLGPPLLDLGYLLVACHAFLPGWPQFRPNRNRIHAVLAGYSAVRPLTASEREHLADAVGFAEAFRMAQVLPAALAGDWRQQRNLTRFYARYPVTTEIARLAGDYLAHSQ